MVGHLVKQFCEEGLDRIRSFGSHILAIEKQDNRENHYAELLRDFHSLKGSARMLGLSALGDALHAAEDVLSTLCSRPPEHAQGTINPLLSLCDAFQDVFLDLHAEEPSTDLPAVHDIIRDLKDRLSRNGSAVLEALASFEPEIFQVLNTQQKETLLHSFPRYEHLLSIMLSFRRDSFAAQVRNAHKILNANGLTISTTGTIRPPAPGFDLAFVFLVLSNHPLETIVEFLPENAPSGRALPHSNGTGPRDAPGATNTRDAIPLTEKRQFGGLGCDSHSPLIQENRSFGGETLEQESATSYDAEFLKLQEWFLDEGAENLKKLYTLILGYEKEQTTATLNSIFRSFHNLKGSGGSYKFGCISRVAHTMESYVQSLRTQEREVSTTVVNNLLHGVDVLEEMFSACKLGRQHEPDVKRMEVELKSLLLPSRGAQRSATGTLQSPQTSDSPRKRPATETLRIERRKLDAIVNNAVELAVAHHTEQNVTASLSSMVNQNKEILRQWRSLHDTLALYAGADDSIQQLLSDFSSLVTISHQQLRDLNRVIEANLFRWNKLALLLRDEVLDLHLQPLSHLFEITERVTRDLTHALQKEVVVTIEGGDVEVDRRIIEALKDPFVHLLRNAIDHGIESPQQRKECGKPETGALHIKARQMGFVFALTVTDDGRGIDLASVASLATEKGIATKEQVERMTDAELRALLFRPGFSTSKSVNSVSGRGVGLDVVSTNVEQVGGTVTVESVKDQGTTFRITLPTTLTSSRVLLLEVDGGFFSMPVAHVEQIVLLPEGEAQLCSGKRFVPYHDVLLPVIEIEDILHAPRSTRRNRNGLIIQTAGAQLCLSVPRIIDEMELITRPLPGYCGTHAVFSGANILPDGSSALVLSLHGMTSSSLNIHHETARDTLKKKHVLVVDDSLISRELLKNILIATGYDVSLARDGQDGLFFLRTHAVDLVLSDIDMPIMDGVSFTRTMKRDPLFRNIPVVMFTSQEDEAKREACRMAGAAAYITKGGFHQNNLLSTINRILAECS